MSRLESGEHINGVKSSLKSRSVEFAPRYLQPAMSLSETWERHGTREHQKRPENKRVGFCDFKVQVEGIHRQTTDWLQETKNRQRCVDASDASVGLHETCT